MKRVVFVFVLVLFGLGIFFDSVRAQDLSQYASLKEPQIKTMPAQKMLVVESKGDPNIAAQSAFSLLFKTFFSIPGAKMTAPRARWLNLAATPKNEWVGLYALPLPEQVASLPSGSAGAKIDVWQYGEVAEILHVGGYDKETPAIERLIRFIHDKSYEIAGPHEEEYLKGPGMAPGPDDYWTIIRYQIKKK